MWEDDEQGSDEDDDFESAQMLNEAARSFDEFFAGFHDSLFDINERSLKPLYKIEVSEDCVRVLFDLPFVGAKEDLSISATDDTLSVEAKMKRPVSMMVGGPYQRNVEFDKYAKKIRLPVRVNPNDAKARFQNGILLVEFALKKPSSPVLIQ